MVTGGRDYVDPYWVWHQLDLVRRLVGVEVLIHGACPRGLDADADLWVRSRGVRVLAFPADWDHLGRRAGPIRNKTMVSCTRPDVGAVFPGGSGTTNAERCLIESGVRIIRLRRRPRSAGV